MNKILVPIDFSPASHNAFQYAIGMGVAMDAADAAMMAALRRSRRGIRGPLVAETVGTLEARHRHRKKAPHYNR